jgi:hypothetical protein
MVGIRPLLRTRREGPRDRRAAEEREELASFQLIELHSDPTSQGRIAGYRTGSTQSGGNRTILQPVSRWQGGAVSEEVGSFASLTPRSALP